MGVPCPKCGSKQTTKNTRGNTRFGTPLIILTCLQCGFQWTPIRGATSPKSMGCGGCLLVLICGVIVILYFSNRPQPQQKPIDNPVPKATAPVTVPALPPANTPKPAAPKKSDDGAHYRALLANAKSLIKAKVYPPARKNLQEIIDEAPATPEAQEAKTLLDSIPN